MNPAIYGQVAKVASTGPEYGRKLERGQPFIFSAKSGEFVTNRLEEQRRAALLLHLLQICLMYILSPDSAGHMINLYPAAATRELRNATLAPSR